jgi:nicotinamide-nucleotide adenylyltransferase
MRRGVYPGSFNPPTTAHLAIAEAARNQRRLDRLDLAVSRVALAKGVVEHPPFATRIEVLQESIADIAWLEVVVTDAQLLVDIADGYDVLVMGADKWDQINDPGFYGDSPAARDHAIARLPELAIAPRAVATAKSLPAGAALVVPSWAAEVSSTRARSGEHNLMTPAALSSGAWA